MESSHDVVPTDGEPRGGFRIVAPDLKLFFDPIEPPDEFGFVADIRVTIKGRSLDVTRDIAVSMEGSDEPGLFFASLSEQADGWSDELTWTSLDGDLTVTAQHGDRVKLRWELASSHVADPRWTVATTTRHTAGDLRLLSEGFARMTARG